MAYSAYCPLPSHSHSKAHSCPLPFSLLMHCPYSCSIFLTCSCTLILVTYLAFSPPGTLSFATLTVRCTPPSTLSSHSPSTHFPLSHHPVRVTLLHITHVLSLSYLHIKTSRCRSVIFILCLHPKPIRTPQRPSALSLSLSLLVALHSSHSQLLHSPRQQTVFCHNLDLQNM